MSSDSGAAHKTRWRLLQPGRLGEKKIQAATERLGSRWTPMLGMDPATTRWNVRTGTSMVDEDGQWRAGGGMPPRCRSRHLADDDERRLATRIQEEQRPDPDDDVLLEGDAWRAKERVERTEQHAENLDKALEQQRQKARAQDIRSAKGQRDGVSGSGTARIGEWPSLHALKKLLPTTISEGAVGAQGGGPDNTLRNNGACAVESERERLADGFIAPDGAGRIEDVPRLPARPDPIVRGAVTRAGAADFAFRRDIALESAREMGSKRAGLKAGGRGGPAEKGRGGTDFVRKMAVGLTGEVRGLKPGVLKDLFVRNLVRAGSSPETMALAETILDFNKSYLEKERALGAGQFGSVVLVRHAASGREYALKTLKEGTTRSATKCAKIEMMVLVRLALQPHDNVITASALDDAHPLMPILLPKAQGDLFSVIHESTWSLTKQLSLLVDVMDGAMHFHSMGIIHRDIKAENVLIFSSDEHGVHAKLADYGFAQEVGEEYPGMRGTLGSIPPECLTFPSVVGDPSHDVFAVAALVLLVIAKADIKRGNMFAHEALFTADEKERIKVLNEIGKTQDVSRQRRAFEVKVSTRTMTDGSFAKTFLVPDMVDERLKFRKLVCMCLPFFLAPNPAERQELASLRAFIYSLVEED